MTRPHRSATQEAGHQVGVAGRGVTLKYVPFNITTDSTSVNKKTTLGWKTAQRRGCSAAQQAGTSARPAQSSSRLVLVRGGPRLECGSLVP